MPVLKRQRPLNKKFEYKDPASGRHRTLPTRPLINSAGKVKNPKDIITRKTQALTTEKLKITPELTYQEAFKILRGSGFKITNNFISSNTGVKSKFTGGKLTAKVSAGTARNLNRLLQENLKRKQNR
ncbi:MAG: hypothetical protein COT90_05320 [Candidatus Diapherotrites archaeon CG10_big_fil_rev_8_21_14_0_10_31_34]|nr:MAG: hypothetical protein COT90_05320 [Candidatus Diapherotrites archaeon CG10_big_fil_rev_8_21_14_0_10_31_34]